jgi:hypothetical protein
MDTFGIMDDMNAQEVGQLTQVFQGKFHLKMFDQGKQVSRMSTCD